jgi:metallo-beta-lactamase family protein
MAYLQSFGAAEVVTGSCHILHIGQGPVVMVDCGMFQGEHESQNERRFGFDPGKIDILLITHAHLDHVGRIPKLVKEGFRGTIIATASTFDLMEVVLLDAAHLMEEEYKTNFRKAQRRGEEKKVTKPLYTTKDVEAVFDLPSIYATYGEKIKLSKDVYAIFRNAGHILDSATIQIHFIEKEVHKTIVFSGDLGNRNDIVMPDPVQVKKADVLYIESTYGDRNHKPLEESVEEFRKVIFETLMSGGSILIPSFAIERTQEILCLLKRMYLNKELPVCKIFLDSPMAIRATNLYKKYHQELSRECNSFLKKDGTLFEFPYLQYTLKSSESRKINDESGCIIIAGSGMCTGGRILHHFKNRIWNPKNAVIFVGYQAKGTLGRKIVEGARWINIYHEEIKVNAKIHTINGFSAHADQHELIAWMEGFEQLGKIFLIHGEKEKQQIFSKVIRHRMPEKKVHIVKESEKVWF